MAGVDLAHTEETTIGVDEDTTLSIGYATDAKLPAKSIGSSPAATAEASTSA